MLTKEQIAYARLQTSEHCLTDLATCDCAACTRQHALAAYERVAALLERWEYQAPTRDDLRRALEGK